MHNALGEGACKEVASKERAGVIRSWFLYCTQKSIISMRRDVKGAFWRCTGHVHEYGTVNYFIVTAEYCLHDRLLDPEIR